MLEPFKIIPGFGEQFAATCTGEIYDIKNKCYLKNHDHQGHYRIYLKGFGAYKVHILVALAYHGEPPFENWNIHHCNRDPLDNRPQNLVYLTRSVHTGLHHMLDEKRAEQIRKLGKSPRTGKQIQAAIENAKKARLVGAKLPRTEKQLKASSENAKKGNKKAREAALKVNSKAIAQYDLNGTLIAKYVSMRDAERQTGVPRYYISKCAKGLIDSYKGCKFLFVILK